jgi:molybdopterin adenylyltransferase
MIRAGIITVSDRGSQGIRQDTSGPMIATIIKALSIDVCRLMIIPDEKDQIKDALKQYADKENLDLIITTGGTGVSPRDITPEATLEIIDRQIPGMAEAMRHQSMQITPHAMISRAVVGIRGSALIINLPGSPKAAKENLDVILPALKHTLEKIKGDPTECGNSV